MDPRSQVKQEEQRRNGKRLSYRNNTEKFHDGYRISLSLIDWPCRFVVLFCVLRTRRARYGSKGRKQWANLNGRILMYDKDEERNFNSTRT
mmetsp:Transcript_4898/g.10478  ORF Transcript_4898/g.10478 Transcript_4898/m.10478 type:complete len:91 (-) Transcript_4898:19-291(-)